MNKTFCIRKIWDWTDFFFCLCKNQQNLRVFCRIFGEIHQKLTKFINSL